MGYRFHILGVPHTISIREYSTCAFTQKVIKLCKMLKARGHTVLHYGHEASAVECDEHITVTRHSDLYKSYGDHDWRTRGFPTFQLDDHVYKTFYAKTIAEIWERKQPGDFLLCTLGACHKPVADAHPDMIVCEPGIGYPDGGFANFRVFESYAILHAYLGQSGMKWASNDRWYDAVIPNYFDLGDFESSAEKEDYFLFLGRVNAAKGVHIALQIVEEVGGRLIIAGAGELPEKPTRTDRPISEYADLVGVVGPKERKRLMTRAKATLAPSTFMEPFCGVQVESMLSGTPVISSDWGAFAEYNIHGVTGYRCRTFEHFTWAARNVDDLDPYACRAWAERNFSLERIAEMYDEYFFSVHNVFHGKGWYEENPQRKNLDWIRRYHSTEPAPAPCDRSSKNAELAANKLQDRLSHIPSASTELVIERLKERKGGEADQMHRPGNTNALPGHSNSSQYDTETPSRDQTAESVTDAPSLKFLPNELEHLAIPFWIPQSFSGRPTSIYSGGHEVSVVTAFFDIGRGLWQGDAHGHRTPGWLRRTNDQYLEWFNNLGRLKNNMIIFTEEKFADRVLNIRRNNGLAPDTSVILYDNLLADDGPLARQLTLIRRAMGPEFHAFVRDPALPEYWNANYVMMMQLKCVLVCAAIDLGLIIHPQIAWVDFGCCRDDKRFDHDIPWRFDCQDRMNIFYMCEPDNRPIFDVVRTGGVYFQGTISVAPVKHWFRFMQHVDAAIVSLLTCGLIDADQTLMLMAYRQEPELFRINAVDPSDWFSVLRRYQHADHQA